MLHTNSERSTWPQSIWTPFWYIAWFVRHMVLMQMPIFMVCMTSGADADAMFTLTVWHMMGTPPTDPGVLPTLYRLL